MNRTVTERDGIDTTHVTMRGIVTKADLREYGERDPGWETKQSGGWLETRQCVRNYLRTEARTVLSAGADCRSGTVRYRVGGGAPMRVRLPLGLDGDTSRASGNPPMIEPFKMLCSAAARRLKVE